MGFWAGFGAEYSRIQDRKNKLQLLGAEVKQSNMNNLLKLRAAKTKREDNEQEEGAALELLRRRLGDSPESEAYLATVERGNIASDLLKDIKDREERFADRGVKFRGENLMASFPVRVDQTTNRVTYTPNQIMEAYDEGRLDYVQASTAFASLPDPNQKTGSYDIDIPASQTVPASAYKDAQDRFKERFVNLITPAIEASGDEEAYYQLENLTGDNAVLSSKAMSKLMNDTYGVRAYAEMVEEAPGVFGNIADFNSEFKPLKEAYEGYKRYGDMSEEERLNYTNRFQYMFDEESGNIIDVYNY